MSVTTDALLKLTPDLGIRPAAARSTATTAAANNADRFAEVYAKERQPKAAERPPEPAAARPAERSEAPARAKPAERKDTSQTDRDTSTETSTQVPDEETQAPADVKPAVAEGGNALPVAEEPIPESELDPLLLLGLSGQFPPPAPALAPAPVTVPSGLPSTEAAPATTAVTALPTSGLAGTSGPMAQAEGQAPTEGGEAEAQLLSLGTPAEAASKGGSKTESFAATMLSANPGEQPTADVQPDAALAALGETLEAQEGAKESRSTSEPLALRLNALGQAISQVQQTQQAQRLTQVPGQPVQMQQGNWSEAVVDRVMWLSSQNLKSAEIQLDPAELGRLEVRIELNKDQTQVTFMSPHAGVREALESQSQRLRDMFTQQGMNLLDVNVSDQSLARGSQGQGDGQGQGRGGPNGGTPGADGDVLVSTSEISSGRTAGGRGLVDFYA
ncbi:flagellar hook-length control protein FliK [Stutzerimonas urumqiensis]|uniref:flagellar hook-length control protein FliK n=1 Tax=Stutzerimonas urumqiensis TaxID=638269 RepID=UPI003BA8C9B3